MTGTVEDPFNPNDGPVEIPKSFAEKIDALGPRFCLVYSQWRRPPDPTQPWEKRPVGKDWNKIENLMKSNDPKLREWLEGGGNYGVVGGFGLIILDADIEEIKEVVKSKLPPTLTVESPGSKGWHCYYLCSLERPIRLRDKDGENVGDIQGQGKMVLGPGSIHPNGQRYRVINDVPLAMVTKEQLIEALGEYVVPEREELLIEEAAKGERQRLGVNLDILRVVPLTGLRKQGDELYGPHPIHGSKTGRNFWVNPFKNCWHCFRHGTGGGPLLWIAVQEGLIGCEEARPGVLRGELFKRALRKAVELGLIKESPAEVEREASSIVDRAVEIALSGIVELFHDGRGRPFAVVKGSDHLEVHPIESSRFERWLREKYYKAEGRALRREAARDAIDSLAAMALYDDSAKVRELHNRVAWHDGAIFYDLADERWRAVKVTPNGWEVVDEPPPLFQRFEHQSPQVLPKGGGSLDRLFEFVNVKDEDDKLLLKTELVSDLIPRIPHPILLFIGPQGSGKSIAMRMLRGLVDPSRIPLLSFNYDRDETVLMLHQHYAPFFDNVSTIPSWLSDILCRACTGDGFTKRRLYTDEDAVILEYKRCVGLNGITVSAERPDFQDRCLTIELRAIPDHERKEESDLLKRFDEARPYLFGAMLDALSKAMAIYPTVEIGNLPRMADFARWGEAIARAMGYPPGTFIEAYRRKVGEQCLTVLEHAPIGLAVVKLMEGRDAWEGTPTALLNELAAVANAHQIDIKSPKWPKSPSWVTRRLREVEANLLSMGIKIDLGRARDRVIVIRRQRVGGNADGAVDAVDDGLEDREDRPPSIDGKTESAVENAVDDGSGKSPIKVDVERQHDGIDGISPNLSRDISPQAGHVPSSKEGDRLADTPPKGGAFEGVGSQEPTLKYQRVKPAEPCSNCSSWPVEFNVIWPDGITTFRLCAKCFRKLRDDYFNLRFIEAKDDDLNG